MADCVLGGLVGLEAGDDVDMEIGAGGAVGQVRGFAEEGAEEVDGL